MVLPSTASSHPITVDQDIMRRRIEQDIEKVKKGIQLSQYILPKLGFGSYIKNAQACTCTCTLIHAHTTQNLHHILYSHLLPLNNIFMTSLEETVITEV